MTEVLELKGGRISVPTVWRYLDSMGFSFDGRKKTFYVDGHEWEDVVKTHVAFCVWYLNEELRMYRWVQLTEEAVTELHEKKLLNLKDSFKYASEDHQMMYDFHVDCA